MEHPIKLRIDPNGNVIQAFHPNEPVDAGVIGRTIEEARGGHVLPENPIRRAMFKALRRVFGGNSPVASWTRTWRGPWIVIKASDGERLPGRFETHSKAVGAEVAWMLETL